MSDSECLQQFVRENSQPAFATLVERHVGLVYSAALRQVRSPQLAEEIAQSVFLDLARSAAHLDRTQPLAAWLYLVTRRTSVDVIRRESRRQTRERTAAEITVMKETPPHAWSHVERSLDDAMETLNETERTAILLRYFQSLSLREVGESLGVSEDTAQKRVSRAVEQLRTFFLRRGVAVTAAGLASDLSGHAFHSAPAALSQNLVSLTLSKSSVVPLAVQTSRPIAMTIVQKGFIAAAALVLATGVFETWQILRQHTELTTLRERVSRGRSDLAALTRRRDDARRSLQVLTGGSAVFPPDSDPDLAAEIRVRLARVKQLRQVIEKNPRVSLPELSLLDNDDWLEVVKDRDLAKEMELFSALLDLRNTAKRKLAEAVLQALRAYLVAQHGNLPSQIADLARMLPPSFDLAMLQRYELLHTGNVADLPRAPLPFKSATVSGRVMGPTPEDESPALIAEKASLLLPEEERLFIGRTGYVIVGEVEFEIEIGVSDNAFNKALAAFAKANHRPHPDEPEELLPDFDPPLDAATQRRITELARERKRRDANNPFLHLKQ